MRPLHFIQVCPDDNFFVAQLYTQLQNFREMGYADKAIVIFFLPNDRLKEGWNPRAIAITQVFREVEFLFYEDSGNILRLMKIFVYAPLLRLWCLRKYFSEHPDLNKDAFFYHDSDIVFTRPLDFSPLLCDEVCYLSDTRSYINASYFDSKIKDVKPHLLEEYKKRDILQETARLAGISREVCEKNNENSGGAQYLLKGRALTPEFWDAALNSAMNIRLHLRSTNAKFFPSEDKGFQSWCADMWAVLFNLWKFGCTTTIVPELDFAWAGDPVEKWEKVFIYHDAGGTEPDLYNKRGKEEEYVNNLKWPFDEDFSYVNPARCSYRYVQEIIKTKQIYNPEL